MIYGYIRVSTDRQTVENQRFEINQFCERNVMVVDKWIEETISGTKTVQERKLGKLLKKMKKEDILVCSELSRLGRNLLMIMGILNECMNRDIQVWTIKDNYRWAATSTPTFLLLLSVFPPKLSVISFPNAPKKPSPANAPKA